MNLYYAAAHLCRYMNLERQAPPGPPPGPPGGSGGLNGLFFIPPP